MCELGIFLNGQVDEFFGPNGCFLPSTDPPGGQCNCGDPIDSEAPCPPCLGGCPDEAFLPRPGEDAIGHIDRIGDGSGTSDPGCFGVDEQPLTDFTSGFNIGCSVLWFVPDDDVKYCSDGAPCTTHADCGGGESCEAERCVGQDSCSTDADCGGGECVDVDRSLLYVAWDISDLVTALGTIPSQYDSDGDGSACRRAEGAPLEGDRENYRTQLRSCVDLNEFNPKEANTVSLQLRADAAVDFFINENLGEPLVTSIPAVRFINPPPLEVLSFPTADGAVSPINACIDQEVRVCTGKLSSGAPCANFCSDDPTLPCRHDGDCVEADAGTCEDDGTCVYGDNINNVESVIKRVETSGWFGPHTGRLCSISLRPCRGLGIDACPAGEGTCTEMAPVAPDSERARQNRIALSRLAALLFADTNSDRNVGGDEEEAVVALRTPLPELEVAKQARCVQEGDGEGQAEFSAGPVEALPGSEVEFAITIRNPGNEDLELSVLDQLTDIHPQVNCSIDCENPFIQAGFISPGGRPVITAAPCNVDSDCPADSQCRNTRCQLSCLDDSECPAGGSCQGNASTTDSCTIDTDCPTTRHECVGGMCELRGVCFGPPVLGPDCMSDANCIPGVEACMFDAETNKDRCHRLVTPANALEQGFDIGFFVPDCDPDLGDTGPSFLFGVVNDVAVEAGLLRGASVTRPDGGVCSILEGDTLTILFRSKMDVKDNALFCLDPLDVDCQNQAFITGKIPGSEEIVAEDESEIVEVDVQCRDVRFEKSLGEVSQGDCCAANDTPGCENAECQAFVCGSIPTCCNVEWTQDCADLANLICPVCIGGGPLTAGLDFSEVVVYRYTATNEGEVPENITITDHALCFDIAKIMADFPGGLDASNCEICPSGVVGPETVPPAGGIDPNVLEAECTLVFLSMAAREAFLRLDDMRCVGGTMAGHSCESGADCPNGTCEEVGFCGDEPPIPASRRESCYRNCATATAMVKHDCPVPDLEITDLVDDCACEIEVEKQVRCLPECDKSALDEEEGWKDELEDVLPGACVQYRIIVTNTSEDPNGVPLAWLRFNDEMLEKGNFESGPDNVLLLPVAPEVDPFSCQNLVFGDEFNWDGLNVDCRLNRELSPGAQLMVKFEAKVKDRNAEPAPVGESENKITVSGSEQVSDSPNYACSAMDTVKIDVKRCELDVEKDVCCVEDRPGLATVCDPDKLAEALPGSELWFRINITNTGNVPLESVTINDELGCDWYKPLVNADSGVKAFVGATEVTGCVCSDDTCATIDALVGFGEGECAGLPNGLPPNQTLTITFRVKIPVDFEPTVEKPTPDCENEVHVSGSSSVCHDESELAKDPCRDDNDYASINVKVPELNCDKQVCIDLNNDGNCDGPNDIPFSDFVSVTNTDVTYPLQVIWKYTLINKGEVPYASSEICDPDLVAHRNANGLVSPSCPLHSVTGCYSLGSIAVEGPTSMRMTTCSIRFNNETEWLDFASKDNTVGVATGLRDFCYDNEATGSGVVDTTTGLCHNGDDALTSVTTDVCDAKVCIEPPCDLRVCKQVRCLDTCDPSDLGAEVGWISDKVCSGDTTLCCNDDGDCPDGQSCIANPQAPLMALPGSCLQYRIKIENIGENKVDVCALKITDTMVNKDAFASGPTNATISRTCTNLTPLQFRNAFNWDGDPVICRLSTPLVADDSVSVLFTAVLRGDANPALDPVNEVSVMGASPSGCEGDEIEFSERDCMDDSEVTVDVKKCDSMVTKDVTCDEPRLAGANHPINPAAVYQDITDALPGSKAAFRIQMTNTGEAPWTTVNISDVLSLRCNSTWYIPNTVACDVRNPADVNGTNVTMAICGNDTATGGCATFAAFTGLKTVTVNPNQILRCTFQVDVPTTNLNQFRNTTEDCINTVEITPGTNICRPQGGAPCGMPRANARINVLVPEVECDKCIRVNGGACLTAQTVEDPEFPLQLTFEVTVSNTGETDLKDAKITDLSLGALGACGDFNAGMADVGNIAQGGPPVTKICTAVFNEEADFRNFAGCSPDGECCHVNTAEVEAAPDEPDACESDFVVDSECRATVCIDVEEDCPYPCDCEPRTKVVFDIYNEYEQKFSGAERCISSWDEKLLSQFTEGDPPTACGQTPAHVPDYFWRNILGTDKGTARINAEASPAVCGPDTVEVPLLGVAQKILHFERPEGEKYERAGMSLVGTGFQVGQLKYDVSLNPDNPDGNEPDELNQPRGDGGRTKVEWSTVRDYESRLPSPDTLIAGGVGQTRASTTQKGSFIVFPKIEIKWNASGEVIQDTFLDMTNDFPGAVRVQLFFVDGDCCVWLDNAITLTQNQPIYWSALTGDGGVTQLSPFTVLGRGVRDPDPRNPGGRVLRGYVVGWAVNPITNREINWNHLKGDAVIVNYAEKSAWEYNAWAFQAKVGVAGQELLAPFGQLDFDGIEYEFAPAELLLDFYSVGTIFQGGFNRQATIDTDLTLWAALKDLRLNPQQPNDLP
jgi:hypothetical protein